MSAPAISILILGERPMRGDMFGVGTLATIETVRATVEVPFEILVAPRSARDRATIATRAGEDLIVVDTPANASIGECHEHLRTRASGHVLAVTAPGVVPLGSALAELLEPINSGRARVTRPRFRDPSGLRLAGLQASGSCLLIAASHWPSGRFTDAPFVTPHLWDGVIATADSEDLFLEVQAAEVMSGGWADRSLAGNSAAERFFDHALLREGGQRPPGAILAVVLGGTSDNAVDLSRLLARFPNRAVTVVTQREHASAFAADPRIASVLVAPNDEMVVQQLLVQAVYERLVVVTGLGPDSIDPRQLRATADDAGSDLSRFERDWERYPTVMRELLHRAAARSCRRRGHLTAALQHEAVFTRRTVSA